MHRQACWSGEGNGAGGGTTIFGSVAGLKPAASPGSDAGPLGPVPASHLSLAVSLQGWPASMQNQTLMGTRVFQWEGELKSSQHAPTDRA